MIPQKVRTKKRPFSSLFLVITFRARASGLEPEMSVLETEVIAVSLRPLIILS